MNIASASELSTARQCLMKHDLSYRQRWTKPTTSPALLKGILWHEIMEAWYKGLQAGKDPKRLYNQVVKRLDPSDETEELIIWMFRGYVDYWGADENWNIVSVEDKIEFPLLEDDGTDSERWFMKAKIDIVVTDVQTGGRMWVVDHKSGKNLPKKLELDLDDQFALYQYGMRWHGHNVVGTLHNGAKTYQTKKPQDLEERFSRTRMSRTEEELRNIVIEARRTLELAYSIESGQTPRFPDTSTCGWKCDFLEPCLMSRKGMNRTEAVEGFGFVQDFTRH